MIERADQFIASLGVEAYRVGGSVRDELLGRRVKDADYMVRGVSMLDLGQLLDRAVKDAHLVKTRVTPLVLRDGRQAGWRVGGLGLSSGLEIVLPRTEVSTGPGHRDFEIVVDPNVTLEEDALRRDFTFNALYRIVGEGRSSLGVMEGGQIVENVVDPLGRGLFDLSRGLIHTTHSASFRDDPLRTLRALRFVARGFNLATDTQGEMRANAKYVTGLSAHGHASGTVLDEMSKILMGDNVAEALAVARDTGVLGVLFPELAPMIGFEQGSRYHDLTVDQHTFAALATAAHVDAPLRVRWALLFHDAGKPEAAWVGKDGRKHYYEPDAATWAKLTGQPVSVVEFCQDQPKDHEVVGERIWREAAERINVPVRLREDVAYLIRHHMVPLEGKYKASKVRQGRVAHGHDMLVDLYLHRACDISGKGKPNKNHMERIRAMVKEADAARVAGVPCKATDLEITGHDAIAAGLSGAKIGDALKTILHEVASQPTERTLSREWQLGRLESLRDG